MGEFGGGPLVIPDADLFKLVFCFGLLLLISKEYNTWDIVIHDS